MCHLLRSQRGCEEDRHPLSGYLGPLVVWLAEPEEAAQNADSASEASTAKPEQTSSNYTIKSPVPKRYAVYKVLPAKLLYCFEHSPAIKP